MRNSLLRILLGLLVLSLPSQAKDWPTIPPDVWAINHDAGPTAHGAVIIEDRVKYGASETEVHRRVRIFGELGKAAVSLPSFNHIFEMEGRTVQPDGSVTPFNSSKDLVSASLKSGTWQSSKQSLIPPGLTSDCVVDIHFRIGTYLYGNWSEISILSAYPTQRKVLEIPTRAPMASALIGLEQLRPEKSASGIFSIYTFKDLPAEESEPYSLSTARTRPMLIFYHQPFILSDVAKQGPNSYWNEVGKKYYKNTYQTNLNSGNPYRDWSKALRTGLQGDQVAKAGIILFRLEEQIQNGSQLTYAELAALPKKAAEERMDGQDLDATVKRKRTSAVGMHFMFFQLLVDEGLNPKLLLVADRDKRIFQYDFPNIYQFTDALIGVTSSSGEMAWFAPSTRYFPPGIVHPDFQGTRGLLLDPADWTCKPYVLGSQNAKANLSLYEYSLVLGSEDTFSLKARFSGFPEFVQRNRFFSLESKEQQRKLKEELEAGLKGYAISNVLVENATDIRKNLVWTLEGMKEAEEGRRRIFSPFPGLPFALNMPDAWPKTRRSPIIIPYCREFTAISRFKLPKGWALVKDSNLVQSNGFGTVSWKVNHVVDLDLDEEVIEVTFFVEVKRMISAAESYADFQAYMGWIETATRRTLALERQ